MEFTSNTIIVVGAGVAGLAAARALTRAGLQPIVLEARDRIGGRILTVHDDRSPLPIESGAEFVHGVHPVLWKVLREFNASVIEIGSGGGPEETGPLFDAMANAPEQSFEAFLRTVDFPEHVKQAATGYVEGFNAAHKEWVGVEWLNAENAASDQIEGDRAFRVVSGYDSVPRHLAGGLDIRLNMPVRRICWERGEAILEIDGGSILARRAIVTVPMAVLFAGGLRLDPEPEVITAARDAIGIGQAIRVTFLFSKAPAEKGFLHGDQPFPVCWTETSLATAWAAGPKADALRGKSLDEWKRIALQSVKGILKEDPGVPLGAWVHDWTADPWSRTAYSYVRAHGMSAQRALSAPVEDTLYFAGEAIAPAGHIGTVHGAIVSGIHAAGLAATSFSSREESRS